MRVLFLPTDFLTVSTDLNDVTLVSQDTLWRLWQVRILTTDGNGDPDDPHDLEKGVMTCDVSPVAMFFFYVFV